MPQDTIRGLRKALSERKNSLTHMPNEIITAPNYKVQDPGKSNTLAVSKNSVMPPPIILLSITPVSKENQHCLVLKSRQIMNYSTKVHYIRCNVRRKNTETDRNEAALSFLWFQLFTSRRLEDGKEVGSRDWEAWSVCVCVCVCVCVSGTCVFFHLSFWTNQTCMKYSTKTT